VSGNDPARPASGPLSGLRVVDLTQFILGPVATQILGDYGADVIKIENPAGDLNRKIGPARYPDMAAMFLGMNRSKRSVVLKVLASDFAATPGAVDRFKREADMIARLEHPHECSAVDEVVLAAVLLSGPRGARSVGDREH